MISIAKAFSADYYVEGGGGGPAKGAESYYLDAVAGGEPAGQWAGSGAEHLGLAGDVEAADMKQLFGKFENPNTCDPVGTRPAQRLSVEERLAAAMAAEPDALPERVEEIRTRIERTDRQSVIGWDVTFSVPKSVTVAHTAAHRAELAAIRSGDTDRAEQFGAIRSGIESAIHDADRAMIGYAESVATARTGGSGGAPTEWRHAPGLTVASFFQHTNRNIDPQLHVHNAILNRAYCEDGKVRALDGADLLAQKHALGAVADRVLDEGLTRMGFDVQLRPDMKARELTVIPTEVTELFSSRRRQVTAKVAELVDAAEERLGRELTDHEIHRLKQTATLATRRGKSDHDGETRAELLDRWWAETVSEVGNDLDAVADRLHQHLTDRQTAGEATAAEWSPTAVLEAAVAAVGEKKSAWTRADLMLEIHLRLPSLDGASPEQVIETLNTLTAEALTSDLARQVSGLDDVGEDAARLAALGGPLAGLKDDPYTRPSSRLYATAGTLLAEENLRLAAIERGGHAVDRRVVEAWLDTYATTIGADQRAAVAGLASSDARLSVLVGPAGTGKSFTAGTFAGLWCDLTAADGGLQGRVIGLATSQIATDVLRDDGVTDSRNIDQWLAIQDLLADGSTQTDHLAWQLGPRDVVMVDEASMVATADLHRIHGLVEQAGARLVLTGDPRQLGAVEAGGVLGLLDGHAETYTLSEVRRFVTDWEADASLTLRDGQNDALATYDRHGRLLAYDDRSQTLDAAARAAVADRLDGRAVVVVTGTNEEAADLAGRIRAQLVDLGLVEETGVLLGRDGSTAGIGDIVMCRHNDRSLGVTNRAQYRVTSIGDDGSLALAPIDREAAISTDTDATSLASVRVPASYVAEDVQLGYASTAHAAQGITVDNAHLVTDGTLDAAGLYVGMSRGRLRNTAHVTVTPPDGELHEGVGGADARASARVVLEGSLGRGPSNRAALVEAELDVERLSSMFVLTGRLETTVRQACRERMNRHLDQLVADGDLSPELRAVLGADKSAENLSRVLRAVEQAGQDPQQALRDAVTAPRGLGDADSIGQVLAHRIMGTGPVPQPVTGLGEIPADIAPPAADHIALLAKRMDTRRDQLAEQVAAEQPAWAATALGPVPDDTPATQTARADWMRRAGLVAAHREATNWEDPDRAISTLPPGVSAPEKRASYAAAWDALGQPPAGLDDAALSDGQLRVRITAREAELAWAPPHAGAALRAAEQAAEAARQAAAHARAQAEHATRLGEHERASQLLDDAARHDAASGERAMSSDALERAANARAQWAAAAAPTLDAGQRAQAEAERRGLTIGAEPDRVTPEEWWDAERRARVADDEHRPVTEHDLAPDTDDLGSVPTQPAEVVSPDHPAAVLAEPKLWGGHAVIPEDVTSTELEAMAAATAMVAARLKDRASQDQSAPPAQAATSDAYEEGRQRRDAADHDAGQATGYEDDLGAGHE